MELCQDVCQTLSDLHFILMFPRLCPPRSYLDDSAGFCKHILLNQAISQDIILFRGTGKCSEINRRKVKGSEGEMSKVK